VEDEERIVDLGPGQKRWLEVEETVRSSGANAVECLDESEAILRSVEIPADERSTPTDNESKEKSEERLLYKDRREIAGILDAQGKRLSEAYAAGADAAARSSDKLLELVETLTHHFALSITNIHNMSTNFVNLLQQVAKNEDSSDDNPNGPLLAKVLSMALDQSKPATPTVQPNNGGKTK
jgi:hypothetical protein